MLSFFDSYSRRHGLFLSMAARLVKKEDKDKESIQSSTCTTPDAVQCMGNLHKQLSYAGRLKH